MKKTMKNNDIILIAIVSLCIGAGFGIWAGFSLNGNRLSSSQIADNIEWIIYYDTSSLPSFFKRDNLDTMTIGDMKSYYWHYSSISRGLLQTYASKVCSTVLPGKNFKRRVDLNWMGTVAFNTTT
jgi:hypothetical protein